MSSNEEQPVEETEEYIAPCYNCQRKIPPGDDCYIYAYRGDRGPDIFCDNDCMRDSGYDEQTAEYSATWTGEVEVVMAGAVPRYLVDQGSKAILAWLWENGSEEMREYHDDWTPSEPLRLEE